MAYIYFNGEKYFPIFDFFSSDLLGLSEKRSSWFEVDELMALPIACLNNKGYLTEMCCSGHAIGNLFCEIANPSDIEKFYEDGSLITVQQHAEYDAEYMCWVAEPSPGAFILFKNSIEFKTIPEGWEIDSEHKRLSCDSSFESNPMTYYKNISAAIERLMAWVIELPPIHKD